LLRTLAVRTVRMVFGLLFGFLLLCAGISLRLQILNRFAWDLFDVDCACWRAGLNCYQLYGLVVPNATVLFRRMPAQGEAPTAPTE
jgi:hypothetical protein